MKNPTTKPAGYVYLIQYGDLPLCKLGYALNPTSRLKELQTGSPEDLFLIKTWPSPPSGERYLHRKLRLLRYKREWFKVEASDAVQLVDGALPGHFLDLKSRIPGFKRSRFQAMKIVRRFKGYSIAESRGGVSYLAVVSRKPDRTSANNSVYPLAGYFNWKSLEAAGLLRKAKR